MTTPITSDIPANKQRNKHVIITSKRRRNNYVFITLYVCWDYLKPPYLQTMLLNAPWPLLIMFINIVIISNCGVSSSQIADIWSGDIPYAADMPPLWQPHHHRRQPHHLYEGALPSGIWFHQRFFYTSWLSMCRHQICSYTHTSAILHIYVSRHKYGYTFIHI